MNAVVRTIRRLDERSEQRTVNGVPIETGIPVPEQRYRTHGKAAEVVLQLQVGESFQWTHPCKDQRARALRMNPGRAYAARSYAPKKWRIWRTR